MNQSVNKYLEKHACNHDRYYTKQYAKLGELSKKVVWHGKIIHECEDCGEDLSSYRLVEVKDKDEYIRGL